MLDTLALDLTTANGVHHCRLIPRRGVEWIPEDVEAAFRVEVLDETLREQIRDETAPVRNLVLALAFSRTGLVVGDDET